MPNRILDSIISLADAAAELGIKPVTLRAAADRGTFTAVKVGGTWITTLEEVDRYRAERLGRPGRPKGS